ncbi:DNA-binding NarL/FixJ family response regulator [Kineococcus xinjiangensis]|uniref:DNA-binding NarL/FixJ family response regulator n=1 Tax=Kineococcus xinjiangensis TaxID=512762 RepID=A0A2S6ID93_9ACTN|nr:response regulator transcription factor [Kineococcus xinjiangensis]PPK92192.1 DNA-binding NarL/FixJ family response regulator [Kineococcus xinjiangensis]
MRPLRIVVADDHAVFREGLRTLLSAIPGYEVVAEAGDTDSAVAVTLAEVPDVAVMDLSMPGDGGVHAIRRIVRQVPQVAVLALTMHSEDAVVRQALTAGARGYVLKDAAAAEIVRAIAAVANAQTILDGKVAASLLSAAVQQPARTTCPELAALTARELEVLERLARGAGNDAIAARLGISLKTVQNHVSNIFWKLGVTHRAEAVARARDAGLGAPR